MDDVDQLFVEQIPRLRRYARALIGDRPRADDLVQDCLARGWERLHLWRRDSDLRAWLFTIMHNLYVNQIRRYRSEPEFVPLDGNDDPPAATAPSTLEDGLKMRDLGNALAALSVEQREVLLLAGLEQLRYEEIARVLDVPLGTVMSRLARARERLRRVMSDGGVPPLRRVK